MKYGLAVSTTLLRTAPFMLLAVMWAGEARAADPNLAIGCAGGAEYTYSLQSGTTLSASSPALITTSGASAVTWSASVSASTPCSGADTSWTCAGMTVNLPSGSVSSSQPVTITGGGLTSSGSEVLNITATSDSATMPGSCTGKFTFQVTSSGGGWGDPHLTTVDGVHYDFQSAGEFTALRDDRLVIQTRQSPVPTATVPITNAYTGITHCVALYTAVAAKLGSTRVTLQPSPGAQPDPKSMQLRVNGKIVELGEAPLVLRSGGDTATKEPKGSTVDGTITRHSDGVIEITDARGTQLVVTPQYWDSQKLWYLNVNVYGTAAHEGTMGSLAKGSWLPALPDGTSVGAKPDSETERYQVLYEKFADAWRVTDSSSLFDYEPGTNTATFTLDEWPRNHPQSCAIEGRASVQPATDQVAQQACANIASATQKADCVFDVMITGNTALAKSYEIMQRFRPRAAGWYTPVPPAAPTPPNTPAPATSPPADLWCCKLLIAIGVLQLLLLVFLVIRSLSKKP